LRATGQFIETESGAQLRAGKFDGGIDDVFDLLDPIAASVVEVVEPSLR
jgi:TolB-like protein